MSGKLLEKKSLEQGKGFQQSGIRAAWDSGNEESSEYTPLFVISNSDNGDRRLILG